MRYIDKSTNRDEGLALTVRFLDNHCKVGARRLGIKYRDDDRSNAHTFCSADGGHYRQSMVNLLRDAQNSMCCYCLRKLKTHQNFNISDQTITIEHIIPDSFTAADDVAYYRSAPNLSAQEVEMTDVYECADYVQRSGIHPHKVAFNNFVLSCKGTFPDVRNRNNGKASICCNEKRGNREAFPVYFLSSVADYVDYLVNGDVQAVVGSPEEAHVKTLIENTNLQCDALRDIRHLWYILKNEPMDRIVGGNADKSKREKLLSDKLFDGSIAIERAMDLFDKFIGDENWETFMLYHAFYDIMKEKYGG